MDRPVGAGKLSGVGGRPPLLAPWIPAVPFKLNQDRRHHIPRQRREVTNWREYDASSHGALLRQADKSSAHWKISGFSAQTVSRVEPVSVLAVPNQNNLTFGRRTWQPHHDPAYGG